MRARCLLAAQRRLISSKTQVPGAVGGPVEGEPGSAVPPGKFRGPQAARAETFREANADPAVIPHWYAPPTILPAPLLRALPTGETVFEDRPHAAECLRDQAKFYFKSGRLELEDGAVVVDVGANTGSFAMEVMERTAQRAVVVCLEPIPSTAAVLRLNLERYSPQTQPRVLNCGLSNKRGFRQFVYPVGSSPTASYRPFDLPQPAEVAKAFAKMAAEGTLPAAHRKVMPPGEGRSEEELRRMMEAGFASQPRESVRGEVRVLGDVVEQCELPRIDVLKVDVEGAEMDVFNGIDAPTWKLVQRVVVEVHDRGGRVAAVERLLGEQGLTVQTKEQAPESEWSDLWMVWAARP
eukprot:Hpha_TRINITY_DN17265_c0_g1::TRINITY_DN17265_c0_g1_i1::g.17943::m.17943